MSFFKRRDSRGQPECSDGHHLRDLPAPVDDVGVRGVLRAVVQLHVVPNPDLGVKLRGGGGGGTKMNF